MTELYRTDHRHIIKRIIVRGILVLDTPTCLGQGDTDSPTDLPLLRDSLHENYALLTGSSIAGSLRNYLRERDKGYDQSDRRNDLAAKLFGDLFAYKDEKDKNESEKIKLREHDNQSLIIIDDAISTKPIKAELRDGVKINSATGTAEDKAKYDLELLQAGTEFPLSFELLIDKNNDEATLLKALAIALSGLEPKEDQNDSECQNDSKSGEISLGMKKRRGFGRCHVKEWQVWSFNLEDSGDRTSWLNFEHWRTGIILIFNTYSSITEAFEKAEIKLDINGEDKRERFVIHAKFQLVGSLLIRSGQDSTGRAPDVVHLKSHRNNELKPVLSGTSLAGVLRHRAERIVNTLHEINPQITQEIVNDIFGFVKDKKESQQLEANKANKKPEAKASRLIVHEKVIKNATELVQNRIAIDRFTGGAYHGALFDEQPIFGGAQTIVSIELELRNPKEHEIGLLLLLLKDLWTSDLPVGGESSIGRGRLQGTETTLTLYRSQHKETWTITQVGEDKLQISAPDQLQTFVQALVDYSQKEVKNDA
ncbi:MULTISPECIES: RAMP superfamily CRISPR-associated protein [unclassified Microcoleus]|uniref:RAMP superfamily CRISPR-associated protein n=1 Tax=unclassified Microcoleus TaxID=2642155 RepID=UPI002FCEBF26